MPNNSGIFSLSNYYDKDLSGDIPEKSRESYREYGYFGGGAVGATRVSTVDRIDYSNDTATASVRGPLSSARNSLAATGNTNFGYYIGGAIPAVTSFVDRINYSNDTSTTRVANNFGYNHGSTGNINYGYIGGGGPSPITESKVDRLDYSNDLSSALTRGSLTLARFRLSATGNSNFGYFIGGHIVSTIDRVNYANDSTTASIRGPLSLTRSSTASTGNRDFGYVAGSLHVPSPVTYSYVDRINYSNDLITPIQRAFLSTNKGQGSFTGNSNFGYFGGGYAPGGNTYSTVDRIDYSNDTQTVSIRGSSSIARSSHGATSSHSFGGSPISQYGVFAKPFGYFGGGSPSVQVDRIDYSTDTSTASVRGPLAFSNYYSFAATGNQNFGYYAGQLSDSPAPKSNIQRIDYSNDIATALIKGNMSVGRDRFSGAGSANYGYFAAGNISFPFGTLTSIIDRLDYSNDLSTNKVRGSLTRTDSLSTGVANSNFVYFVGGSSQRTNIVRLEYSNDTANTIFRLNLLVGSTSKAATGNSTFGYIGGGDDATVPAVYSLVQRIDYANDTTNVSIRGPLTANRRLYSATGNQNFGYYGGGFDGNLSSVDRIDYANDTATASTRGPLTAGKRYHSATSPTAFGGATDFQPTQTFFDIQSMKRIEDTTNASVKKRALGSFGYFGGGLTPTSNTSIIDRIDYSNDLSNAIIRGNISTDRRNLGGCGNQNFGYFGGGGFPTVTTIDRIDYSNDSKNLSLRGALASSSYGTKALSNINFGYFGGGFPNTNNIGRIDFSNDNVNAINRSLLTISRFGLGTVANSNFGYFAGGIISPSISIFSRIDRINYSNDTAVALIRGSLSESKSECGSSGNSNFGYFSGGFNGGTSTRIERIDYLNDLVNLSIRGPLSSARTYLSGTGTLNFGYLNGSGISNFDRINYSNDLVSPISRGTSTSSQYKTAATTNARNS